MHTLIHVSDVNDANEPLYECPVNFKGCVCDMVLGFPEIGCDKVQYQLTRLVDVGCFIISSHKAFHPSISAPQ